jgi:hypothetical protein
VAGNSVGIRPLPKSHRKHHAFAENTREGTLRITKKTQEGNLSAICVIKLINQ